MDQEIVFKLGVDTGDTVQDIGAVDKAIESLDASTKNTSSEFEKRFKAINDRVNSGTLTVRELGKAVKEYQNLALQAGTTSPLGEEILSQAGELNDSLGDLRATVVGLGTDGAKLQAALQLGSAVTAGYTAFQGVTAMLGVENEDLLETIAKLQAAQSTLTAIESIRAALEKESILMLQLKALWTNIQTAASNKLTVAQIAQNSVTAIWTALTGAATAAMAALNAVMAINPAVLLVVAFAALAGAIAFFASETEHAEQDQEKLNAALEKENELLDLTNEKLTRNADNRIKIHQAEGQSEEVLHEDRLNKINVEEKVRKRQLEQLRSEAQRRSQILRTAIKEGNKDVVESSTEELNTITSKYKKLKALDGQYYVNRRVEIAQFTTDQRKQAEDEAKEAADKARDAAEKASQAAKERRDKRLQEEKEAAQLKLDLEKTITDLSIANIEDEWQRKFTALAVAQQREREELTKKYGADTELIKELETKQRSELLALDEEQRKAVETKETEEQKKAQDRANTDRKAKLEAELIQARDDFEVRMEVQQELALLERNIALENMQLTEGEKFKIQEEYKLKTEELDKSRLANEEAINLAIVESRRKMADSVAGILGLISELSKKNSAAQKAFAITQLGVQTALGFIDGLRLAQKAALETPTPIGKALVFTSFFLQQANAVKKTAEQADAILGAGVSVQAPTVSNQTGAQSPTQSAIAANNETGTAGLTNNGATQVVLPVDSLQKVMKKMSAVKALNTVQ